MGLNLNAPEAAKFGPESKRRNPTSLSARYSGMARFFLALVAGGLLVGSCVAGEVSNPTTDGSEEALGTTLATTSSSSPSTTSTIGTTTTRDPESAYEGTSYTDSAEIGHAQLGGWHIADIGPGPSGFDSPFWGTRWESGSHQMLWFEKDISVGHEVLDVVAFPVPGPSEDLAVSGCISAGDDVDYELHGVARHTGNNQWTLLQLWRADRTEEVWIELEPADYVVEPATGDCELGAGDGPLP